MSEWDTKDYDPIYDRAHGLADEIAFVGEIEFYEALEAYQGNMGEAWVSALCRFMPTRTFLFKDKHNPELQKNNVDGARRIKKAYRSVLKQMGYSDLL